LAHDEGGADRPPRSVTEEIAEIEAELRQILPRARISRWDKWNWGVGLALATGGIVLAPLSAGLSLGATALGLVLILADMAKKIRESAQTDEDVRRADELIARLGRLRDRLTRPDDDR
jgi:hypothetical protein